VTVDRPDEAPNLATLRDTAEKAPASQKQVAWAAYWAKHAAEVARRDALRAVYSTAARALGARIGRLPGVVVESAEADDWGRAELCLLVDGLVPGRRYWTRAVSLHDRRGYQVLRDAIAAARRKDWRRAYRWLKITQPQRRTSRCGGVEQVFFVDRGW
jgi:hypothetical protein